jgi:hypothetical protein
MEPKFKYVDIVFENCICIRLLQEDIRFFYVGGISKYIWCNGKQYTKGQKSEYVILSFYNSAFLRKTDQLENPKESDGLKYHLDNYHDITHICIGYLDGNEDYIDVPWKDGEENESSNPWERVEYYDGYFTITIEKVD